METLNMSTNIDAILAAAKASAENLPAAPALVPVAPLAPVASMPSFSMDLDSFLTPTGMEVASYLQVKDAGIKLSKDWGGYIDGFEAEIDLTEVAYFMGVRKEVGSTVTYAKSYNGQTTTKGEPFMAVVAQFQQESAKNADPYRGADVPMTLVGPAVDPKNAKNTFAAGDRVGLSTSITGFKPWASFHKKLKDAGQGNARIKVKVVHSPRRNAAGQDYGVCEFELLEILGAAAAEAA
jgi:hypothetical protein